MEILKIIASFLTPLVILLLGIKINRNIERNKLSLLKEKEWQVRWAETFLVRAIEYSQQVSIIITALSRLNSVALDGKSEKEESEKKELEEKITREINESIAKIQYLDWDIRNFVQFAENGDKVIEKQVELSTSISDIFKNKQGDLEMVRKIQAEYNKLVRVAHNNILNVKA